jgi:hypothetical protein
MTRELLTGANLRGPLELSGSAGSVGQVLKSAGPGAIPTWGAASGGGGVVLNSATLDFGANPQWSTEFTITSITASVGQNVMMVASGNNGDELEFDGFTCAARVTATDTIQAWVTACPGPVAGTRSFLFLLS